MDVKIFIDGACARNPGPGGWAAVFKVLNEVYWFSGSLTASTNNRAELSAAINALRLSPNSIPLHIYSDSLYVVNTIKQHYKRKTHLDLWREMEEILPQYTTEWYWIKGHNGNCYNSLADSLAKHALKHALPLTVGLVWRRTLHNGKQLLIPRAMNLN